MNFNYTKEQIMYKDSAKNFFNKKWSFDILREVMDNKGFSEKLWKDIAELGWTGMLIDEKYEGFKTRFLDICPILEEIGKVLFTSPLFASSIMGASIISKAASDDIKNMLLPSIANGTAIITLAVIEQSNGWAKNLIQTKAEKKNSEFILNGTKFFVPFADSSDYIICCAKQNATSEPTLFLVKTKSKGVNILPLKSFSTDTYNKVVFDNVKVPEKNIIGPHEKGWDIIEDLFPKFVISNCIMMIGGMQKVLEMTVQYVKERNQFNAPIGSFQAIQHTLADMAIDVEASKYITYKSAWKVSENYPSSRKDVAIAKAWTGDAYKRVTACAHQLHGAFGFTDEYDLHFYYKQAKSMQLLYGGSAYHKEIVAQETGY